MRELMNEPKSTPVRKAPDPPPAASYMPPPFGSPYGGGVATAAPSNNWEFQPANLPYPLGPPTMPTPSYR